MEMEMKSSFNFNSTLMGSNFILFPLQILWGSIEITIFLFSLSKQIFEVYFFPNLNLKSSLKK